MQCPFLIFSAFASSVVRNKPITANLLIEDRSMRNGKGTVVKVDAREDTDRKSFPVFWVTTAL